MFPKNLTTKNIDEETIANSGFLIVKTYDFLLRSFSKIVDNAKQIYAIPTANSNISGICYDGLDREALDSYKDSSMLSEIRLSELEADGDYLNGFLWSLDHARDVVSLLE